MNHCEEIDKDGPFSVDIFIRRLRFSKPFLISFFQHLYRWSIYVFIPFSVCLLPGIIAYYVIVNILSHHLNEVGIAAVIIIGLIGIVVPRVLLMMWYRSIPWWFLNGIERDWEILKIIAQENKHRFPDDFWHPFVYGKFGLEENASVDEMIVDFETDIHGFVGSNVNILYAGESSLQTGHSGFYLDNTYWKMEKYGLRFYGERMNIFVPYQSIQSVKKRLLWCNIIIKLDTDSTFDTSISAYWTELCISVGHLPTMRGDRMLRDELHRRIAANVDISQMA